jgi:hypothetical protein
LTVAIVVWFLITVFLLGFWGWTTYLLFLQKKSWKAYAAKFKLRYRANRLFESPDVNGSIDGYKVSIFTTDHEYTDGRSRRMLTTIEISMQTVLPVPAAIASGGMVKLVEDLSLAQEFRPDIAGWDVSYVARSHEKSILENYLTTARVEALSELMKEKRSWLILIFSGDIGLLRIDTPDALEDPKKLSVLVQKMINLAKICELADGEDKLLLSKRVIDDGKKNVGVVIPLDNHGLSLEDE